MQQLNLIIWHTLHYTLCTCYLRSSCHRCMHARINSGTIYDVIIVCIYLRRNLILRSISRKACLQADYTCYNKYSSYLKYKHQGRTTNWSFEETFRRNYLYVLTFTWCASQRYHEIPKFEIVQVCAEVACLVHRRKYAISASILQGSILLICW